MNRISFLNRGYAFKGLSAVSMRAELFFLISSHEPHAILNMETTDQNFLLRSAKKIKKMELKKMELILLYTFIFVTF